MTRRLFQVLLDLRTRTKLLCGSGIMTALVVLVAAQGYRAQMTLDHNINEIYDAHLELMMTVQGTTSDLNAVRAALLGMILAQRSDTQRALEGRIRELSRKIDDSLSALARRDLEPRGKRQLEGLTSTWIAFRTTRDDEIIPAIRAGRTNDALQVANGVQAARYSQMSEQADALISSARSGAERYRRESAALCASSTRIFLILSLVAASTAVGLVLLLNRLLARPLGEAVEVFEAVAAGDMSRRIDVRSRDELGLMGAALNRMVEEIFRTTETKVSQMLSAVEAAARGDLTVGTGVSGDDPLGRMGEGLDRFLADMGTTVGRIAIHAHALASASVELSAVSGQLNASADEASSRAGTVSAGAQQISLNAQIVATSTEEMQCSIQEIARRTHEALEITRIGSATATSTNASISRLAECSEAIGRVVQIITAIAGQIRILALNATIEAARAGESGRGFAVVAGEVKSLADETARATNEIRTRISAIQTEARTAVEAMREIASIIGQTGDHQGLVAGAVQEQTATTAEIARNVSEAAKGSTDIARDIEQVARGAADVLAGAGNIEGASGELARMSSKLQTLVGCFHVSAAQALRAAELEGGAVSIIHPDALPGAAARIAPPHPGNPSVT